MFANLTWKRGQLPFSKSQQKIEMARLHKTTAWMSPRKKIPSSVVHPFQPHSQRVTRHRASMRKSSSRTCVCVWERCFLSCACGHIGIYPPVTSKEIKRKARHALHRALLLLFSVLRRSMPNMKRVGYITRTDEHIVSPYWNSWQRWIFKPLDFQSQLKASCAQSVKAYY